MKRSIGILICFAAFLLGSCKTIDVAKVHTGYGDMLLYLYKKTPQHRANFIKLANEHYFDSTTFHRIIPNFVIQGGDPNSKDSDPTNDGEGGPSYTIPAEIFPDIKHKYGAVGAARDNNPEKRSSGSQFYIVVRKGGTAHLDGNYTVFGEVLSGMNVADSISMMPRGAADRPLTNIPMKVEMKKMSLSKLKRKYHADLKNLQAE